MKVLLIGNLSDNRCGFQNFTAQMITALRRAGVKVTVWDGTYTTVYARHQASAPAFFPTDHESYDVVHLIWNAMTMNHYSGANWETVRKPIISWWDGGPSDASCPFLEWMQVRWSDYPRAGYHHLDYPVPDWVEDLPEPDPVFTIGASSVRGDGIAAIQEVCHQHGWATNLPVLGQWLSIEDEIRRLARSTVNVCWYHTPPLWHNRASAPSMLIAARRPVLVNTDPLVAHLLPYHDIYRGVSTSPETSRFELDQQLSAMHDSFLLRPMRAYRDLSWTRATSTLLSVWQDAIHRRHTEKHVMRMKETNVHIGTEPAVRRTTCRGCGGQLDSLLDLGSLYLSTFLLPGDELPPKVPLELTLCRDCDLVQLRYTTNPDRLYRRYWYQSGINESMRAELANIVDTATTWIDELAGGLSSRDTVIDIGANDGTLLSCYPQAERPLRIAFEPAFNLHSSLRQHAEVLLADYFPAALSKGQCQAKIITSIAMFYDLDDPHKFLSAIADLLHPQGVWVVQFQDLWSMTEATGYDNCCFEHLTYYSLKSFESLLDAHGLMVTQAEHRAINGGSLRLYVQHARAALQHNRTSIDQMRAREEGLTYDYLQHFAWRVREHKAALRKLLQGLKAQGQILDVYGASTKAQTLLQYCQLDTTIFRSAVERSSEKVGRRMVGSNLPIVSEETWRQDPGQSALLAIWGFKDQVFEREAGYLDRGGAFILPMPSLQVVYR